MDAALREILRELAVDAPEVYHWLMRMLSGAYSRGELKAIARGIVEMARNHPARTQILRALAMILRSLGLGTMPSLAPAGTVIAGGTAGGAPSGGAAAAGGASAAMTIGVALVMLLALGILTYRIYNELTQEIDVGSEGGIPCAFDTKLGQVMAHSLREIVVDTWRGRKASMQLAIDKARKDLLRFWKDCVDKSKCCPEGQTCKPVLAVVEIKQWSKFPYITTFTRITFTIPCICVEPNGYWYQWDWEELPDSAKEHWNALGWDKDNWEGAPPESGGISWEKLTEKERDAAKALGYDKQSWNEE